jgi:bifunctional enzyme CysN/CysC/sulfate adenylyltransferase subunit 1
MALPSGQVTRVRSIVTYDGKLDAAVQSQSVTLELEDEIDVSRGDMLVSPDAPPSVSRSFSAMVVWLNEGPLELNRTYLVKHTTRQAKAQVTRIQSRVDVNTFSQQPARVLEMNGIALVELETSNPLFFDSYDQSRATGSFILVDPFSNATVAAGMIREDLSQPRDTGSAREIGSLGIGRKEVTSRERFERHGHRPAIFLLPKRDLLAESVERALFNEGFETVVLDGDAIPPSSVAAVLRGLWWAGLVVLFAVGKIHPEARCTLETLAGDSLFDFANVEEGTELTGEIVSCAELLRIDRTARPSGKAD